MEVAKEKQDNTMVFNVVGRIDSNTSGDFEKILIPAIDSGEHRILINFEEVDFISSAGLRVLLQAAKRLNVAKGKIGLINLRDSVKEVFDIAGLTPIFPMYDSRDDAVRVLSQ